MITMKKIKIAVIDNYPVIGQAFVYSLKSMGFEVTLKTLNDLQALAGSNTIHACCVNITSLDAQSTALQIKQSLPGIKVIGYALNNTTYALPPAFDLFLFKSYSRYRIKRSVEKLCAVGIESG